MANDCERELVVSRAYDGYRVNVPWGECEGRAGEDTVGAAVSDRENCRGDLVREYCGTVPHSVRVLVALSIPDIVGHEGDATVAGVSQIESCASSGGERVVLEIKSFESALWRPTNRGKDDDCHVDRVDQGTAHSRYADEVGAGGWSWELVRYQRSLVRPVRRQEEAGRGIIGDAESDDQTLRANLGDKVH